MVDVVDVAVVDYHQQPLRWGVAYDGGLELDLEEVIALELGSYLVVADVVLVEVGEGWKTMGVGIVEAADAAVVVDPDMTP